MAENKFQLNIERMIANENYKVVIAGLGSKPVTGFLQDDIKFGGGNNYNNPFESEAQQKLSDVINKGVPAVAGVAKSFGYNVPTSQFSLKSFDQTIESWTGSQKPSFSMRLTFLALGPDDDVTDPVRKIMRAVMPTGNRLVTAPLGYGVQITNKDGLPGLAAHGTLAIRVGKWFQALGQICRKAQPTISKECIASGLPLYSIVEFEFEPYRAISYSEFLGYWRKGV